MTSSKEPGGVRAILKDIFAKKKAVAPAVADRYLKDQIINVLADNIGPFDKGLIRLKLIKGCGLPEDALDARAESGFFGADVLFHALQEMIADGEIKIARGDGLFTGDDPVYYCLADNETQPEAKETSMQSESEIKTAKDMPAHEAVRARNRKIADIIKETMADGKSMTSAEIAHVLLEKGAIANSDMLDAALYDMVVKSAFLKFDDKAGTYRLADPKAWIDPEKTSAEEADKKALCLTRSYAPDNDTVFMRRDYDPGDKNSLDPAIYERTRAAILAALDGKDASDLPFIKEQLEKSGLDEADLRAVTDGDWLRPILDTMTAYKDLKYFDNIRGWTRGVECRPAAEVDQDEIKAKIIEFVKARSEATFADLKNDLYENGIDYFFGGAKGSECLKKLLAEMVALRKLDFDDDTHYRLPEDNGKNDGKNDVNDDAKDADGNPEGVARELLSAFSDDDLKQEIKRRCEKAAELEAHYVAALRKKGFAGSVLILKYSNLGDETMNVDDFSQALSIPEGADRVAALKAFRDYLDENIAKHSQE